jgi:hypothetical protein
MEAEKTVLTIKQTAAAYSFPEFGLRTLIKCGAFPVIKCGTRVYIVKQVFEEYLKTGGMIYDGQKPKRA